MYISGIYDSNSAVLFAIYFNDNMYIWEEKKKKNKNKAYFLGNPCAVYNLKCI